MGRVSRMRHFERFFLDKKGVCGYTTPIFAVLRRMVRTLAVVSYRAFACERRFCFFVQHASESTLRTGKQHRIWNCRFLFRGG